MVLKEWDATHATGADWILVWWVVMKRLQIFYSNQHVSQLSKHTVSENDKAQNVFLKPPCSTAQVYFQERVTQE